MKVSKVTGYLLCGMILAAGILFFVENNALAEEVTITTYYPAPYGVYVNLRTLNDGERVDIGFDENNPSIELRDTDGTGLTPFIDFSNDATTDYDARIRLTGNDSLAIEGANLEVAGWYGRTAHNNGGLVGSYNNVGANSHKTNPIYVIGSNYKPADATLSNMYGIGYTHTNASFITDPGPNSWGMYVASDGDARIWLAASAGGSSYFNAGNVGIGTTSPSNLLHVSGNPSGATALAQIETGATGDQDLLLLTYPGANVNSELFKITNSGGTVFDVRGNGNVGIGTTSPLGGPDNRLTVQADDDKWGGAVTVRGNTNTNLCAFFGIQTTDKYVKVNGTELGVGYLNVVLAEHGGNVGIGTTSPGAKLHVNGDIHAFRSGGWNLLLGKSWNEKRLNIGYYSGRNRLEFSTYGVGGWESETIYAMSSWNFGKNITVAGSKSAMVLTSQGPTKMYALEAADTRFEDFGSAELINGEARIELDSVYMETISDREDYIVFVTLEDDCNGIYVSEKRQYFFEVNELNGGKSNAKFSWRIVGKRRGFEDKRLEVTKEESDWSGVLGYLKDNPKVLAQMKPEWIEKAKREVAKAEAKGEEQRAKREEQREEGIELVKSE